MNRLNQERNKNFGYVNKYQLSSDVNEMQGDGMVSFFRALKKDIFNRPPKILNKIIRENSRVNIKHIEVCRNPIMTVFQKGLNILTFGRMKKVMNRLGYDKLYHLYMVITLENGNVYSIEKNQRVNIIPRKVLQKNGECTEKYYPVKKMTLDSLFATAMIKVNGERLWRYSAFKNNCQRFIYDVLNSNGINQFNDFILQDVNNLANKYVKAVANRVTDVANVVEYLIRGGGIENNIIPDSAIVHLK